VGLHSTTVICDRMLSSESDEEPFAMLRTRRKVGKECPAVVVEASRLSRRVKGVLELYIEQISKTSAQMLSPNSSDMASAIVHDPHKDQLSNKKKQCWSSSRME
jgi:hypothetical protein